MSPELDAKLCEKYPKIFINRNQSPQETCMHWGFECGDGWYNLIDDLCTALTYTFTTSIEVDEVDAKRLGIEPSIWSDKVQYFFKVEPPQIIANQVKQKFGTLRFYYYLVFDSINEELTKSGKYPELIEINKRYRDYVDGIVHFADIMSGVTCEVTGKRGRMHVRGGWFKVLNDDVVKEEIYAGFIPYVFKK
jgi:hypothetical protein